jgi:tetratricopeptide (TPR) repeat protein
LGDLYYIYDDLEDAKQEYLKALNLYRQINYRSGILITFLNFTRVAVRQGLIDEAEAFYQKMIRLARRWRHVKYEMEAIGSLGMLLYRQKKKPNDSMSYLHQAVRIARQLGSPSEESRWKYHIGNLLNSVEKHEKAYRIYAKELAVTKELGNINLERALSVKVAQTCYLLNNYQEAYASIERAVLLTDKLRTGSLQERHRISYLEDRINIYELAVDICLALGKKVEALEYVEKGKSRALMDLVATAPLTPRGRSKKTNDLIRRESEILQQLKGMQNFDIFDLTSGTLRQRERPVYRYHALMEELDEIYTALEKVESQYVSLRRGITPGINAIEEALLSKSLE